MNPLTNWYPRLVRRPLVTLKPRLKLTSLATHKAVGREKVRLILETLHSYSLHRTAMTVKTVKTVAVLLMAGAALLSGCTTVRQGEVGVKRKLGRLDQQVIMSGPKGVQPFPDHHY